MKRDYQGRWSWEAIVDEFALGSAITNRKTWLRRMYKGRIKIHRPDIEEISQDGPCPYATRAGRAKQLDQLIPTERVWSVSSAV